MSVQHFRIGLVKPAKQMVVGRSIKATDKAWREAIFGLGGSRKRIGGIKLGTVHGQPLALLAELQTEVRDGLQVFLIQGEHCTYGIAGPAAVYNDLGYGPATLGISMNQLQALVTFDPSPEALADALRRTAEWSQNANAAQR